MGKNAALTELQTVIRDFISEKPNRSAAELARRSGVSPSVVRRAANGEIFPSADNLIRLVLALFGSESVFEISHLLPKELLSYIESEMPYLLKTDDSPGHTHLATGNSSEEKSPFADFLTYVIYSRISESDLATRNDVKNLLGQVGEDKLNDLIKRELVLETGEGKLVCRHKAVYVPVQDLKPTMINLIDQLYSIESSYAGGPSVSRLVTRAVSLEGAKRIKNRLKDCYKDIEAIAGQNPGPLRVFSCSAFDTMEFDKTKTVLEFQKFCESKEAK